LMALTAEAAITPPDPSADLFEGVDLLHTLILEINNTAPVSEAK
jgi:hypothetical protein